MLNLYKINKNYQNYGTIIIDKINVDYIDKKIQCVIDFCW